MWSLENLSGLREVVGVGVGVSHVWLIPYLWWYWGVEASCAFHPAPWLSPYTRAEGRPFTPACICARYRTRVSPAWFRGPVIGEAGCQGQGGKAEV